MTILIAPLVLAQTKAPIAPLLDKSLAAHQALNAASVTITSQGSLAKQKMSNTYRVAYVRPHKLSIRLTQSGADRSYFVLGNSFVGYDRTYNEYLGRTAPANATLLEKVGLVMQTVDESIQLILEPKVMKGLYDKFRTMQGWIKSDEGGTTRMLRYTGPAANKTGAAFFFDKKTNLLRGATFFGGDNVVVWRYEYGAKPNNIAFNPPKDAIKVGSFLESRPKPKYGDVLVKKVAEGAARAYDGLKHVEMTVTASGAKSRVWISGARTRERQPTVDWSYADGWLTIHDLRKNRLYKGKADISTTSTHLAKLGARVEPVVRQLRSRQNPMRALLDAKSEVRRIGVITMNGAACDLLEVKSGSLRVSTWVRQKDRLLQSVESRHVDKNGRTILSSDRDYQYVSIGKPLPASAFKVGGKLRPQPLSKVRK